jgi:hypothetical protein
MEKVVMFLNAVILISSVVIYSSCSDDDVKKSKTDMLTRSSWKITKAEIKSAVGTFDVTSDYLADCEKDDITTYSSDGAVSIATGADDCDGDSKPESGTWSWKENETILSLSVDGVEGNPKVEELTESIMKLNVATIPYDANGDLTYDSEVDLIFTFIAE